MEDLENMSDEDLMSMPEPTIEPEEETANDEQEEETVEQEDEQETETEVDEVDEVADEEVDEPSEEEDAPAPKEIDYKAQYEKVMAPFKANGKEVQVDNIDNVIQLMQMGANYNKKMASLKPNLKLMKMLANNDLLAEDKLNYLIDLNKKNPDAITKLIKDSGIDPLDMDVEKEAEYVPNTYNVKDAEIELDNVLDEIESTDSYNQTIDIIGTKWDEPSKVAMLQNPAIIRVINDHVALGIYDQVAKVVENKKMLGQLAGLSDLDAYKAVGDAMRDEGAFNDVTPSNPPQAQTQQQTTQIIDHKLKDRKKAASSTKGGKKPKGLPKDFNPLDMSDEEFDKLAGHLLR